MPGRPRAAGSSRARTYSRRSPLSSFPGKATREPSGERAKRPVELRGRQRDRELERAPRRGAAAGATTAPAPRPRPRGPPPHPRRAARARRARSRAPDIAVRAGGAARGAPPRSPGGRRRCRGAARAPSCAGSAGADGSTLRGVPSGRCSQSGSSLMTDARISEAFSPANSRSPVSISKRTTPNAQMSARLSTALPLACSGDM